MGIIESVQQYDLNIPAGGAQNIDVAGDRVQFISATDPFAQIEIRPNYAQGNISLKPGQGFRFSEQVTRWVVFNRGSVALTGYLMIGSGDFFDQRISGDVNVIDGGKSRSLAGLAYMGSVSFTPAAGNYAHAQIFNPAGSGKRVIVEQISISIGSQTWVEMMAHDTALAASSSARAKYLGQPDSAAQLIQYASVGLQGTTNGYFNTVLQGGMTYPISLREPIVLGQGKGFLFRVGSQAVSLSMNVEFFEETI